MNSKYPVLKAILIGLIPVVCASVAVAASQIVGLNEQQTMALQTVLFGIAILIGIPLVRQLKVSMREFGFRTAESGSWKNVLYLLPVIVAEVLTFLADVSLNLNFTYLLLILIFTTLVGICEELYYRGILLKVLAKLGSHKAVLTSAIIFGILHLPNALSGNAPTYVALQIIFAFVFGFAAAGIVLHTKSLYPVILWHFAHDFLSIALGDGFFENS
ncbi:MAG: CPBP family intramembrane metalloprotease [Bacteroidales bacterium]|jgi:membrane protease YdiL (CAAX protease family)|nr:CPBP family intramembrane metalloprotease [Bacteroidales bacterium]